MLADAEGGPRAATLLATGSEVAIALKARDLLQSQGVPTAVVSMPCCERFDAQDGDYRRHVLGRGTVRVAIEAAVRFGWDRYLGDEGGFVGMTGFGASGAGGGAVREVRHHGRSGGCGRAAVVGAAGLSHLRQSAPCRCAGSGHTAPPAPDRA